MDGQQEPVRYKSNWLIGSESDSVVSFFEFFVGIGLSDKRKFGRRQGEKKDNKYKTAPTSTDEEKHRKC